MKPSGVSMSMFRVVLSFCLACGLSSCRDDTGKHQAELALEYAVNIDWEHAEHEDPGRFLDAARYYEGAGENVLLAKSLYYAGKSCFSAADYDSAYDLFWRAVASLNGEDPDLRDLLNASISESGRLKEWKYKTKTYETVLENGDTLFSILSSENPDTKSTEIKDIAELEKILSRLGGGNYRSEAEILQDLESWEDVVTTLDTFGFDASSIRYLANHQRAEDYKELTSISDNRARNLRNLIVVVVVFFLSLLFLTGMYLYRVDSYRLTFPALLRNLLPGLLFFIVYR